MSINIKSGNTAVALSKIYSATSGREVKQLSAAYRAVTSSTLEKIYDYNGEA